MKNIKSETVLKNITNLTSALATYREEFIAKAIEHEQAFVDKIADQLEVANWDLYTYAPRFSSFSETRKWRESQQKKDAIAPYTTGDNEKNRGICGSPRDPYFIMILEDAKDRAKSNATAEATAQFEAYVAKLAVKIGEVEIVDATVSGNLWVNSILSVKLADGSAQKWKTKCIINHSVYWKAFYQFPTRISK